MPPERQDHTHRESQRDEYWTQDVALFEGAFAFYRGHSTMVRGKVHTADEVYRPDVCTDRAHWPCLFGVRCFRYCLHRFQGSKRPRHISSSVKNH